MRIRRWVAIAVLAVLAVGAFLRLSERLQSWILGVSREGMAPYERLIVRLSGWTDVVRSVGDSVGLASDHARLEQRVRELEMELQAARLHAVENLELRRQLDFAALHPHLVFAEVLSMGGSDGWSRRIRIGRGRRHGVRPNCPVLAPEGLVGRVIEVTDTTADVLLITDANSQVAAMLDEDPWPSLGILMGGRQELSPKPEMEYRYVVHPLRLNYLDKDATIPGQARVLTSGLGGVYPRGLPIGRVVDTTPDASGLFQRADVQPFVDFADLRYLAVLIHPERMGASP